MHQLARGDEFPSCSSKIERMSTTSITFRRVVIRFLAVEGQRRGTGLSWPLAANGIECFQNPEAWTPQISSGLGAQPPLVPPTPPV
jgi:hypothetical protein